VCQSTEVLGLRGFLQQQSYNGPVNSTSSDSLNWSVMPTLKCMSLQSPSYSLAVAFLLEECVFTLA
jgi:hypothetical protein